jgi:hypothetical protein
MSEPTEKRKPGRPLGYPKSGGRMPGVKNKTTRLREQRMVERLITENLSPDEVANMTAVQVLCRILRYEVLEGDRAGAKATAAILAPYQSARLSSSDLRITNVDATKSDEVIEAELVELRAKLAAARALN